MSELTDACIQGNLDIVKSLLNAETIHNFDYHRITQGLPIIHLFSEAAKHGHIEILKYMVSIPVYPHIGMYKLAFYNAAINNHTHILHYILSLKYKLNVHQYLFQIIKHNHLSVLKFLVKHRRQKYYPLICDYSMYPAGASGNIDMINYILSIKPNISINSHVLDGAVEYGHIHIVEFILQSNPNILIENKTFHCAAIDKQLDMMKYIFNLNSSLICNTICFMHMSCIDFIDGIKFVCKNNMIYNTTVLNLQLNDKIIRIVLKYHTPKYKITCTSNLLKMAKYKYYLICL